MLTSACVTWKTVLHFLLKTDATVTSVHCTREHLSGLGFIGDWELIQFLASLAEVFIGGMAY